jgi:MATE family, multidrug efflux pump
VGLLGAEALAGVLATMFTSWALFALAEIVTVGVLALVARAIGAGDGSRAGAVVLCGGALAVLLGLMVPAAGLLGLDALVGSFGLAPGPATAAKQYLSVVFLGYPTLLGYFFFEAVFRGAGDTRTPMVILAASFLLNIALDPLLILGADLGPIQVPALGVHGAALATIGSRAVGCFVLAFLLWRSRQTLGLARPQGAGKGPAGTEDSWLQLARRILGIGIPASGAGLAFCAIYFVLLRITAQFGTPAVAALGLGIRLEAIGYFFQLACGRAIATVAGQNLGAGQVERARHASRRAVLLSLVGTAPIAFVMLFFPEPVVRIFVSDPRVVEAAVLYLQIVSWAMFPFAVEVVLNNVAAGVGDTVPAMGISGGGTALRIPLALGLMALGLGYTAIFWAIAITIVLKAVAFEVWFRSDRWSRDAPPPPSQSPDTVAA